MAGALASSSIRCHPGSRHAPSSARSCSRVPTCRRDTECENCHSCQTRAVPSMRTSQKGCPVYTAQIHNTSTIHNGLLKFREARTSGSSQEPWSPCGVSLTYSALRRGYIYTQLSHTQISTYKCYTCIMRSRYRVRPCRPPNRSGCWRHCPSNGVAVAAYDEECAVGVKRRGRHAAATRASGSGKPGTIR